MRSFIEQHEKWLEGEFSKGVGWSHLKTAHLERLADLRHERLVHLLVTLGFAVLTFISLGLWLFFDLLPLASLFLLLLILLLFYIRHYWLLENSAQRWMEWVAVEERQTEE